MTPRILSIRKELPRIHEVARRRHRGGENARRVVQGISDSIDALLRRFFGEDLMRAGRNVALVAVGGYGRRELCPHSDIDLMFLCDDLDRCGEIVEKMVRDLWDSGVDLGHSVRSLDECLRYMKEDDVTAATLLESRFLAGSESLMRSFEETVLTRYRKSHREAFVRAKLEYLRSSIKGEGRTIYVTEPHLKDGVACLRDIQHILWIERMRRQVVEFGDIASQGGFSYEDVRKLEEAYDYYLRLRCELHFVTGLKQDLLEAESQPEIARNLGYVREGEDIRAGLARMMGEYYRNARHVRSFAREYIETKARGERFFTKLRRTVLSSRVGFNLTVVDGRLYISDDRELEPEDLGERILRIFAAAQENDVELSESTAEWIRQHLALVPGDFARSTRINQAFLWILQKGKNAGRILTRMHELGVLIRIIPEFAGIDSLVTFDGHHQFTVDEHTLRTLRELDRIETQPDYPEPDFQRVLQRIPDRVPLRVALLLHDIGKAQEGSHDATGTEAAIVICERLGFEEDTIDTIEFLVYRHLAMFRYSERMDFTDEAVIEAFARMVKSRSKLDMLYLMTYIDIRSVGSSTWTAWKGVQLAELYQRTCVQLEKGSLPESDTREALTQSRVPPDRLEAILDHCRLIDHPAYERETIPERMDVHLQMVERFLTEGVPQVTQESMLGCTQITFCAGDRPRLFSDLTGILVSEGLNILGARIYSRRDGVGLDVFQVVAADDLRVDMDRRVDNVRKKLQRIGEGQTRVDELVRAERRRYRGGNYRKPLFPPQVRILNNVSPIYSVVEVNAGDRPRLLYDLSVAIADLGLDVQLARVSTMVDRARDIFHVTELDGSKIANPVRIREVEEALMEAAQWKELRDDSRRGTTLRF